MKLVNIGFLLLLARVGTRGDFIGGSGGRSPLVKISALCGGSAPLKLLHWLGFQSLLALLLKCYDQLCTAIWLLRHFLLLIILYQY